MNRELEATSQPRHCFNHCRRSATEAFSGILRGARKEHVLQEVCQSWQVFPGAHLRPLQGLPLSSHRAILVQLWAWAETAQISSICWVGSSRQHEHRKGRSASRGTCPRLRRGRPQPVRIGFRDAERCCGLRRESLDIASDLGPSIDQRVLCAPGSDVGSRNPPDLTLSHPAFSLWKKAHRPPCPHGNRAKRSVRWEVPCRSPGQIR